MDDKTLLELAAKAAGIDCEIEEFGNGLCIGTNQYNEIVFNPLINDGDALRLAVKLAMEIDTGYSDKFVKSRTPGGEWFEVVIACSAEIATRRAIVRAAAEIGKNMLTGS
jgi:hypothetical protein